MITQIPPFQNLPPAGHPDIAFRPACTQVNPILQGNGLVAHTIPLPDGTHRTLVELPPMADADAFREMDAMGLCKVGGDLVPMMLAIQLPQDATAQPIGAVPIAAVPPTAAAGGAGFPWLLVLGGVAAIALVGAAIAHYRGSKGLPTAPTTSTEVEPTEPTAQPAVDLIDQLWS